MSIFCLHHQYLKNVCNERICFPQFQTLCLTPITGHLYCISNLVRTCHGQKCQKWLAICKEDVKLEHAFIGVKQSVWILGTQFQALFVNIKKYFWCKEIRYTSSAPKITKILCIFNENKLYPDLIEERLLGT